MGEPGVVVSGGGGIGAMAASAGGGAGGVVVPGLGAMGQGGAGMDQANAVAAMQNAMMANPAMLQVRAGWEECLASMFCTKCMGCVCFVYFCVCSACVLCMFCRCSVCVPL